MTKQFLVTGGAGFIGSNYVARLIERGEPVIVYDNLSRAGAQRNIDWLHKAYGKDAFKLIPNDIRSADDMRRAAEEADVIVHLAAQVAVTTSVTEPREDFEINAQGTFNMLEAARAIQAAIRLCCMLPPTRYMAGWKRWAWSKRKHTTAMPICQWVFRKPTARFPFALWLF
jgi:nucleoside-diphosphate-sugar epimerase